MHGNVSINKSDLSSCVKQTQYASTTQAGVVKLYSKNSGKSNSSGLVVYSDGSTCVYTDPVYGTNRSGDGKVITAPATADEIEAGTQEYKPITPARFKPYKKSIDSLTTYSTTPVQVGTWIDGVPVWRVAFDNVPLTPEETATDGKYYHWTNSLVNAKDYNNVQYLNAVAIFGTDPKCCVDSDIMSFNEDFFINASFQFCYRYTAKIDFFLLSGYIDFITPESNLQTT